MKRTYIAAALLACAAAPAMAADVIYYSPTAGGTVVTQVPGSAVVTPAAPVQYYYQQDQAATISVVQQQLRAAGYSVSVNGMFDARTSDALRDFQRSRSLAVNGNIDQPTMAALGISSSVPVSAVTSVPVVVANATPVIIAPYKPEPLPRNYEGSVSDNLGGLGFDRANVRWAQNY